MITTTTTTSRKSSAVKGDLEDKGDSRHKHTGRTTHLWSRCGLSVTVEKRELIDICLVLSLASRMRYLHAERFCITLGTSN